MRDRNFDFHHESRVALKAPVEAVFAHLDDFEKLSAHMERSSGMMLGSSMDISTDDRHGRAVGSQIIMRGKVLGLPLSLREVVTQREPPLRKAWETVETHLAVIGQYRLGFELEPSAASCRLRVFIDYDHAPGFFGRWLGRTLGKTYARWCTQQMVGDAAKEFGLS
jgi:hypothetical protein